AKEIFEAEFANATLLILKDPRICRFVPFWLDVLKEMKVAPRIVIPLRSPLEVAHSLKKRNALSLTKGLLLWLRHVLDAEAQTRRCAVYLHLGPIPLGLAECFRQNFLGHRFCLASSIRSLGT